jgi:predicted Holliday junction resolvase-like endonuclease
MNNSGSLLILFVIALIIVGILALAIGYFLASSTTKSALLKQLKEQRDEVSKQAQEQLQSWKDQELSSIKQQTYDAAKGQAIQEMQAQVQKWQENELRQIRQQMLEGVRGEAIKEAQEQLVKWRTEELENAKSQMWGVLTKEANVSLEQWKVDVEKEIRKDAIDKSQSVTMGKMTEHLVPYLPGFGFNPSDARFIGSPIDLVVFDGLGNDDVKKIVFVEIKTGSSTLSTRERLVRDAVLAKNVEWKEVVANLESPDVIQEKKLRRRNSAA